MKFRRIPAALAAMASVAIVAGCQSAPQPAPEEAPATEQSLGTVVVGSQAYYSNEIVAEIYAQVLEEAGFEVERRFQIGQRDLYIPALEAGEVDLFPEYTGNLLQFYVPDASATQPGVVYEELVAALPDQLTALAMSPATDQDSYNVTRELAAEFGLVTIADLATLEGPIILGGAPELEERPYGPRGLSELYGLEVEFLATGATTLDSLLAGEITVANIYTGDPAIAQYDLVTLEDPEGLFLASHLVPIARTDLAATIAPFINPVSEAMTAQMLVQMNLQSTSDQRSAADIAAEWRAANGF